MSNFGEQFFRGCESTAGRTAFYSGGFVKDNLAKKNRVLPDPVS